MVEREPDQAMILGRTDEGEQIVACSVPEEHATLDEMHTGEPAAGTVRVTALEGCALQFRPA